MYIDLSTKYYTLILSEKSHREEDRANHEHSEEVEELHKDLHEKDQRMEEVVEDFQVQIQVDHF